MGEGLIHVTAGVLARHGTVFVCQRPAGGYHPGKWEFPGGKVQPGESLAAALRRELHEELAIDAVVGRLLWRTTYRYPGREPLALVFFGVPRHSGTMTNRIFAAVQWVPINALAEVDFLAGDREFVTQLQSGRVRLD